MADVTFSAASLPEIGNHRSGGPPARLDVGRRFLCRFSVHHHRYVNRKFVMRQL